jgi:hypothetical protein
MAGAGEGTGGVSATTGMAYDEYQPPTLADAAETRTVTARRADWLALERLLRHRVERYRLQSGHHWEARMLGAMTTGRGERA